MIDSATSLTSAWAPAKVNLYLHVGKPNANGRHPLDSLVMFADARCADRIIVRPQKGLSLTVEGSLSKALKGEKQNLVLKAAALLREAAGRTDLGAAISLLKELPTAAGIGGGSADAAATLQALNHYWDIGFGDQALIGLAGELGADVPACLMGEPVVMRGEGEHLSKAHMHDIPAILVNPGVKLSTADVYKKFDMHGLGGNFVERDPPVGETDVATLARSLKRYGNDLEAPAFAINSVVKEVIQILEAEEGALLSRMSGSGSTCFALFETFEAAQQAAVSISSKKKKWWVKPTMLTGSR